MLYNQPRENRKNMSIVFTVLFFVGFGLAAYLLGSIPTARIIGHFYGVDITKYGSHNAGGTNVGRVLGWKNAIVTMFLDAMKVYLPCTIAMLLLVYGNLHLIDFPHQRELLSGIIGLCAALGHSFPIYCRFRGGKCVSCFAGYLLFVSPVLFGIGLAVFALVMALGHRVSLASVTVAPSMIFFSLIFMILDLTILPEENRFNGGMYYSPEYMIHLSYVTTIVIVLFVILILLRHRTNIERLKKKEEPETVFKSHSQLKQEMKENNLR